jgi:DNA-binding transcriptional regulator YiaG
MKSYISHAFGFPLVILNPKFKTIAGEKVLDINYEKVSKKIFFLVLEKKGRLVGGELKFIREYLQMNQTEFADIMGLGDHSIVSRWENKQEQLTNMVIHKESIIRMKAALLTGARLSKNVFEKSFDLIKNIEEAGSFIEFDAA